MLKLHGDHDVFGDGSVVVKRAPGHTPGSQALFVRLASYGPVVVSGDIVHNRDNWKKRRVPSLNFDRAESLASMAHFDEFLRQTGAKLLIQHDLAQNQGIPHAPEALR